jgi:transcriptional regulator GlxA family with amidase domain
MPITDITAACGFQSPPHFSKCYRSQFGYPPSEERKIEGRSSGRAPNNVAAAAI